MLTNIESKLSSLYSTLLLPLQGFPQKKEKAFDTLTPSECVDIPFLNMIRICVCPGSDLIHPNLG